MEFLVRHFIAIGFMSLVISAAMLIGAVYVAIDLYLEYKRYLKALNELERYRKVD